MHSDFDFDQLIAFDSVYLTTGHSEHSCHPRRMLCKGFLHLFLLSRRPPYRGPRSSRHQTALNRAPAFSPASSMNNTASTACKTVAFSFLPYSLHTKDLGGEVLFFLGAGIAGLRRPSIYLRDSPTSVPAEPHDATNTESKAFQAS